TPSLSQPIKESPLQLWKVGDRRWTIEEEVRFGKWVEENITEDFFIRYNIPIDCADVPYAVRWIYARIAHLPAAATTKDGKWIGHWSTEWGKIPIHSEWHKDLRFRKALHYLLSETTTRTLPLDTYPVRIGLDSATAGTVFFITESHAGIIGRVILDGSRIHPLQTWEATSPVKLQKMSERDFLTTRPESTIYSGLVKFRWPILNHGQWKYLPALEHPFYSLEQYSGSFSEGYSDFVEAVAKRIDPTDYDPWDKMEKVLDYTAQYLRERIPIVLEGYRQCHQGKCPEGSPLWETHSTPNRDGKIILLMDHLHYLIESNSMDQEWIRKKMETIFLPIAKGRLVTFYHLYQNYLWLSPHPGDPIESRWGLNKCEMILSQLRSAQNSIDFVEKTYRKRDPRYADFSVRQQQEIIRRLIEEWERSQCQAPPPPPPKKKKIGR
ncbi:MAG: hypothetical protein HXY44_09785, partial [Syntrophaceae bacterium]|nr:hypothetical protein [Syntrophaceae bacterium]